MLRPSERGAVAVEFALLMPIFLLVLMGIVEFGHAFNAQITLTQAAREGVRVMAITESDDDARVAAINAGSALNPDIAPSDIAIAAFESDPSDTTTYPDQCREGKPVRVVISYELESFTGFITDLNLEGKGVMRCGG